MKQGRYSGSRKKRFGGLWKAILIFVLINVLLIDAVAVFGVTFVYGKLGKVTTAQFEEKNPSDEEIAGILGSIEGTAPSMPEEYYATEPTQTEETTPVETESTEPAPVDYGTTGKIVNILVVGQDSRTGEESKLADSIMMMTLNKETRNLTVTSFLRDSYIDLPDYYRGHTMGWNRINTSYALGYSWFGTAGAMELLNLTLKNNFGVEADATVEVSFESFETVVDYLGGLDVELSAEEAVGMTEDATLVGAPRDYVEGMNHMNGFEALNYARVRHCGPGDSDFNRTERQRKVVNLVLEKCKSMSLSQLNQLLDDVLPMVVTSLTADEILTYTAECLPYLLDLTMTQMQIPAAGSYWGEEVNTPDGWAAVLKIDFNKNRAILKEVCSKE